MDVLKRVNVYKFFVCVFMVVILCFQSLIVSCPFGVTSQFRGYVVSLSDVFHVFVHDACLGSGVSHSVCLCVE